MPKPASSRVVEGSETRTPEQHHQDKDHGPGQKPRAYQPRLWPPPCLQAYCLDHFMMECEIYHEQENERYNKLVAHTRAAFLAGRNNNKTKKTRPTRHQPPRQAKKVSIPPPITTLTPPQPSTAPFKPARLEKAFQASQAGSMLRILSGLHAKLELHKPWGDYRPALEEKIHEAERRQRGEIEKGNPPHQNCAFGGPLGLECRYCGFAVVAAASGHDEEEAVTPRKLAAPAAMHSISAAGGETREWGVMLRGTSFFVDVCGGKTMIVLVDLHGVLDLCGELFGEMVVPETPVSMTAWWLRGDEDERAGEARRRLEEGIAGGSGLRG